MTGVFEPFPNCQLLATRLTSKEQLSIGCNLLATQDTGHFHGHLVIDVIMVDRIIARSRNDDHFGITLITSALSTLVLRDLHL